MNEKNGTPVRRSRVQKNAGAAPANTAPQAARTMPVWYDPTARATQNVPSGRSAAPQQMPDSGVQQAPYRGVYPTAYNGMQGTAQNMPAPPSTVPNGGRQNPNGAGYVPQGTWYAPPPQPKQPRRANAEKKAPKKNAKKTLGVLLPLLAVLLIAGIAGAAYLKTQRLREEVAPYTRVFLDTVTVDGISLKGKTLEEGSREVWDHVNNRENNWYVRLRSENGAFRDITADMLGISFDPTAALNQAWAIGHSGAGTLNDQLAEIQTANAEPHAFFSAQQSADTSQIDSILSMLESAAYQSPTDAYIISFNPDDANNPFTYQPEIYGRRLDTEAIRAEILTHVQNLSSGEVILRTVPISPNVTVADLSQTVALRCRAVTPISKQSTEERTSNIRTALGRINGMSIAHKGKFSFNGTCKARTAANGYLPAVEYVFGQEALGIGGGVCQASTTVYLAAIQSGMTITKRVPHSMAVSYTDLGMDATVNSVRGHEIDFSFRNECGGTIYIAAHVIQSSTNKKNLQCEVRIYGPSLGDTQYKLVPVTTEVIPKPEEPIQKADKDAEYVTYTDQTKTIKGRDGYVVEGWLVTYVNGTETERKKVSTDTYSEKADTVYTGVTERGA